MRKRDLLVGMFVGSFAGLSAQAVDSFNTGLDGWTTYNNGASSLVWSNTSHTQTGSAGELYSTGMVNPYKPNLDASSTPTVSHVGALKSLGGAVPLFSNKVTIHGFIYLGPGQANSDPTQDNQSKINIGLTNAASFGALGAPGAPNSTVDWNVQSQVGIGINRNGNLGSTNWNTWQVQNLLQNGQTNPAGSAINPITGGGLNTGNYRTNVNATFNGGFAVGAPIASDGTAIPHGPDAGEVSNGKYEFTIDWDPTKRFNDEPGMPAHLYPYGLSTVNMWNSAGVKVVDTLKTYNGILNGSIDVYNDRIIPYGLSVDSLGAWVSADTGTGVVKTPVPFALDDVSVTVTFVPDAPVPEPTSMGLILGGLLLGLRRSRK